MEEISLARGGRKPSGAAFRCSRSSAAVVVQIYAVILCLALARTASAQSGSDIRIVPLDSLSWRPMGSGVEIAVADGNPNVTGQEFIMVLQFADGAWITPHTHNIAKRLLVLEGALLLGHGARIDTTAVHELRAGAFAIIPAEQAHYEGARGRTIVALFGIGPLRTTMLRPDDTEQP